MARRRTSESGDSLELLLDTVCNVFGGIIFVAMLIAILTSRTADKVVSDHRAATTALVGNRSADSIRARISKLEASLEEATKTSETIGTTEVKRAQAIVELVDQRRKEARERADDAKRWLKRFDELEEEAGEQLDRRLSKAKTELDKQEIEAGQIRVAKTIQGRLPVERRTNKRQVLIILSGARAYVVPAGTVGPTLVAGGHGGDVELRNLGPQIVVTPKAGEGILIDEHVNQHDRLKSLIGLLRADRHFFDLFVTADSPEEFRLLRQFLTEQGFSYNVHPTKSQAGSFIFGPTDSVFVQ